jgi:hypothetical protein
MANNGITSRRRWALSCLAIIALLSGCATGPRFAPAPPPDQGNGTVYIYRTAGFSNAVLAPGILFDRKNLGELKNGGYFVISLNQGAHFVDLVLIGWSGDARTPFFLNAGESLYFRVSTTHEREGNTSKRGFALERVPASVALPEIAQTNRLDAK